MADYIKKIRTSNGDKQIDYEALANLPTIPSVDTSLTNEGAAADAKATGDAISQLSEENIAIDNRVKKLELEQDGATGSSGMSTDLKSALKTYFTNIQTLIEQMVFSTDEHIGATLKINAQAVVTALESTEEEPEQPEVGIVQTGSILAISSGVTATQTDTVLMIA